MLKINNRISISEDEVAITAMRSQGAGGQNVNKVASAIHLRFDIQASSLPEPLKQRLLALKDRRITKEGILVIKAQQFRTQEKNRSDAILRLGELIQSISVIQKVRRPTKPTKGSQRRRLESKKKRGETKAMRGKVF